VRRHPWAWAIGTLLAVALLAGWWLWSKSQRYLQEGMDLLNIGRYADARSPLEQAKRWNPLSSRAGCGLKAIELDAMRSDPEQLKPRLAEATLQYPNCAYLKVLAGEQKYINGDMGGALKDFEDAVQRERQLAEAHFDMGLTFDAQHNPDSAIEPYKTACDISPHTARYCDNLADLYFRQGDYPAAIKVYGKTEQHPNSRLELAKIYRLQRRLAEAAEREEEAIRWLNEPSAPDEQQNSWLVDKGANKPPVELTEIKEKQCYAELELAVTEFLRRGDENATASAVSAGFGKCASRQEEVKAILQWELRRLGSEVPQYTQRTDRFTEKFWRPRRRASKNERREWSQKVHDCCQGGARDELNHFVMNSLIRQLTLGTGPGYKSEREFAFVFHVEQFLRTSPDGGSWKRGWKRNGSSRISDVDGGVLRPQAAPPRPRALPPRPYAGAALPLQPGLRWLR